MVNSLIFQILFKMQFSSRNCRISQRCGIWQLRTKIYGVQSSTLQKFTAPALQYFAAEEKNLQLKKIEELKRNILGQKVPFLYFACIGIKISLVKIKLKPRLKQKGETPFLWGAKCIFFQLKNNEKLKMKILGWKVSF